MTEFDNQISMFDEKKLNSRFVEFCRVKGIDPNGHFKTWEYMAWISEMVNKFAHECKMAPGLHPEEFNAFLRQQKKE